MAIKTTCKKCGGVFMSSDLTKTCPECKQKEKDAYYIVKEYLYARHGATISEVHQNTGVGIKEIEEMIAQGKIDRLVK